MRYPRWVNQLYAELLGYFWLPCPLCGTPFGGHERTVTWWYTPWSGWLVCWKHGHQDIRWYSKELVP